MRSVLRDRCHELYPPSKSRTSGMPPVPVFVEEGKPAPAVQFTFAGTTLGPVRKVLILSAVTRELNEATPNTAEAVILSDRANASIDIAAFGTGAGDAANPPGLLNDVTPIPPASMAGAERDSLMTEDLANLVGAIADAPPREVTVIKAPHGASFRDVIPNS